MGRFTGGQSHNIIPSDASATLLIHPEDRGRLADRVAELGQQLVEKHWESDPGLRLTLAPAEVPEQIWIPGCAHEVLTLVSGLHHGVFAWHRDFPQVPASSANAARLWVEEEQIQVGAFLRCTTREQEEALASDHRALAERCGFAGRATGYPGWAGDSSNPLARMMAQALREQTGTEAEITAVHVGLEPSILGTKAPDMVMAMSGPDILDAHSTDERANLDTLPRYAAFLAGTLEKLSQMR